MNLSISNIAWNTEWNHNIYTIMQKKGFSGLEIAPTKIFPIHPYQQLEYASSWKQELKEKYGLRISSMQSIWYGRQENLFRSEREREALLQYTKQAILFAECLECKNLVFGCPKNRYLIEGADAKQAISFFYKIGEYALQHNTVIGMEANPTIYHTNYMNSTKAVVDLMKEVGSRGFQLNLDLGTMIENQENLSVIEDHLEWIHHVHISEPYLKRIISRKIHLELADLLRHAEYSGYISIEMEQQHDLEEIVSRMDYVKEIFG